jgi:hypothetical protein
MEPLPVRLGWLPVTICATLFAAVLAGLALSVGASALSARRTAHAHRVCHASRKHGHESRVCPRLGRRSSAAAPVVNASLPASVTKAAPERTANRNSPVLPPTPGGLAQGEVEMLEEPEASERVGTSEQFPVCTPSLEAKMITCEVPENYGT